jgi:hypothetical protein
MPKTRGKRLTSAFVQTSKAVMGSDRADPRPNPSRWRWGKMGMWVMPDRTIDAIAYFRAFDQEIDAMFKHLDGPSEKGAEAKDLAGNIARLLIKRSRLFDAIVFPVLRQAAIKGTVIDSAERNHLAIWLLATDLLDLPVHWKLFYKYLQMLEERFRGCVESDEPRLWAAARASGVDLINIGSRLTAASCDDAGPPPWSRPPKTGSRIPH